MTRILSQSGNVIEADFRRRDTMAMTIAVTSEVLYRDDAVMLTRTSALFNGEPFMVLHFASNLATGTIKQL